MQTGQSHPRVEDRGLLQRGQVWDMGVTSGACPYHQATQTVEEISPSSRLTPHGNGGSRVVRVVPLPDGLFAWDLVKYFPLGVWPYGKPSLPLDSAATQLGVGAGAQTSRLQASQQFSTRNCLSVGLEGRRSQQSFHLLIVGLEGLPGK